MPKIVYEFDSEKDSAQDITNYHRAPQLAQALFEILQLACKWTKNGYYEDNEKLVYSVPVDKIKQELLDIIEDNNITPNSLYLLD